MLGIHRIQSISRVTLCCFIVVRSEVTGVSEGNSVPDRTSAITRTQLEAWIDGITGETLPDGAELSPVNVPAVSKPIESFFTECPYMGSVLDISSNPKTRSIVLGSIKASRQAVANRLREPVITVAALKDSFIDSVLNPDVGDLKKALDKWLTNRGFIDDSESFQHLMDLLAIAPFPALNPNSPDTVTQYWELFLYTLSVAGATVLREITVPVENGPALSLPLGHITVKDLMDLMEARGFDPWTRVVDLHGNGLSRETDLRKTRVKIVSRPIEWFYRKAQLHEALELSKAQDARRAIFISVNAMVEAQGSIQQAKDMREFVDSVLHPDIPDLKAALDVWLNDLFIRAPGGFVRLQDLVSDPASCAYRPKSTNTCAVWWSYFVRMFTYTSFDF